MATAYTFLGSEQVTEILGPTLSQEVQQVTAQAIKSQVVFVMRFPPQEYQYADDVSLSLNQLAERFDEWSAVQGVDSISTGQEPNAANQLRDYIEVTVVSTSGKSSEPFRWVYPVAEFQTVEPFIHKVEQVRAQLDAVEGK